ncbi:hypothetical protein [Arthrobacter sp. Y81]|uniref:hypothetical protein n=1 Tax=Arthrobacter sp. Y81 TaxID=2058897 RepID=UPI000CE323D1|nr:hypothetical protein [Arthrobacter sp. Y81]
MASEDTPAERREITVRRAPKYVPFLILGGLVGIIVAAVIAFALPGDPNYEPSSVFGFFLVLFGASGVILGAIVALLLDRLSVRRTEHAVVEAVPETGPGSDPADGAGNGTTAGSQS